VTSEPIDASSDRQARAVDLIAGAFVVASARLDPIEATFVGIAEEGVASSLTDFSPAGFAERAELDRATLRQLAAVAPADESERVAVEAMTERLSLAVELGDAGIPQSQLSVIDSPLHSVREVFDLADSDTEEDWVAIATRLRGVPAALAGYTSTLREYAGAGQVTRPPRCARWSVLGPLAAEARPRARARPRSWPGRGGQAADAGGRRNTARRRDRGRAGARRSAASRSSAARCSLGHRCRIRSRQARDLARRLASGTGGLSRVRLHCERHEHGHDGHQADGHALLR